MTQAVATQADTNADRILEVLVAGNLSTLTAPERLSYYNRVCDSLGLNPLTKPFEFLTLNGKLVMYATKACTDQLRDIKGISISITDQKQVGDLYMVTVSAQDREGRVDSDMGVVAVGNLKGENLANAMLKAVTKAKRRCTLSIAGLGMLDETEVADIPDSAKKPAVQMPRAINPAPPAVDVETGEIQPDAKSPTIWSAFWARTRGMGFSEAQVRDFSGMQPDQFDALNREGLQALLNDLKVAAQPTQPALG